MLQNFNKEQWKVIEGHEDFMVSDQGNVKNINYRSKGVERPVAATRTSTNVYVVRLHNTTVALHKLVAEAFIGKVNKGQVVRHRNGCAEDCRAKNLDVCSRSTAITVAHLQGRYNNVAVPVSARNLKTDEVTYYKSISEAASALGVAPSSISRNIYGYLYSAGGYDFNLNRSMGD